MTDPETIAAMLTPAQRHMVLESEPDDINGREGIGIELHGSSYRVARSLERLGIGDYTHGSSFADMYWNKASGLAVRAIIKAARHD